MIETYRLTLTHYAVDTDTGKKVILDYPIAVERVCDIAVSNSPNILNRMFDEMKSYALEKMCKEY